jgi:hypothetical protein
MKQLLLVFLYLLIAFSIKGQYQAQVIDGGMDFPARIPVKLKASAQVPAWCLLLSRTPDTYTYRN